MNQTQLARINTQLALVAQQTGHLYRLGLAKSDPSILGEHYLYVERRVDGTRLPHVRETFGEWMNFLEMNAQAADGTVSTPGNPALQNRDPFGARVCTESLLDLIYSSSVIKEASVMREILDVMATMGYQPYGVVLGGRDDHLEVSLELRGPEDNYHIHLTVNTK